MDAIIIDNNASIIRVYYIINLRGEIYGEISVLLFTSIIVWSHIHSNDFLFVCSQVFFVRTLFFLSFANPLGQVDIILVLIARIA